MGIDRYDAPGLLDDFARIEGQAQQWSDAVSGWFDENIAIAQGNLSQGDTCQFYNQVKTQPVGAGYDQPMVWNGFPGTLRNRYGRTQALELAEHPVPLTQRMDGPGSYFVGGQWETLFYRPNDEYCEWHATRDEEGRITRVTFTSEPPEYWQAMHGDTLANMNGDPTYPFTGDPQLVLELYRELVSPLVQPEDLICPVDFVDARDPSRPVYRKGQYNPYNRWNTVDGVMHLTHPANTLSAEINLAAVATVLYQSGGRAVADPDALICCAQYGGTNRTSDPTIGSSVNALATLGAAVTLRNPVGLSMHHIDLTGFTMPSGEPIDPSFWQVVRGNAELGLIERAVFEVPAGEGYTVSDVSIGGVPITVGGQIAEHVVVNLVGTGAAIGSFNNSRVACDGSCCQDREQGQYLMYRQSVAPCAPSSQAAFDYPDPIATPPASSAAVALADNPAALGIATERPHSQRPHHRTRTV